MTSLLYRCLFVGLLLGVLPGSATAQGALHDTLDPVAGKVAHILKDEGETEVALGEFKTPPQLASSVGPGLGHVLSELLAAKHTVKVKRVARLAVQGTCTVADAKEARDLAATLYVEVISGAGKKLGGFSATLTLKVAERTTELDNARTLATLFAVTAALPPDEDLPTRREQFQDAMRKPKVYLEATRVRAAKDSPFAVELVVNGVARTAAEEDGLAFVKLAKGEAYGVRISNDSDFEVAAWLNIDGLSWCAFSNVLKGDVPVLIPPKQAVVIPGWHITHQRSDAFEVTAFAKAAAAQLLPAAPKLGSLTVTFARAWPKDTPAPEDELAARMRLRGGEKLGTGRGAAVEKKYETVERHVGVLRAAITVRYDRPN